MVNFDVGSVCDFDTWNLTQGKCFSPVNGWYYRGRVDTFGKNIGPGKFVHKDGREYVGEANGIGELTFTNGDKARFLVNEFNKFGMGHIISSETGELTYGAFGRRKIGLIHGEDDDIKDGFTEKPKEALIESFFTPQTDSLFKMVAKRTSKKAAFEFLFPGTELDSRL